MHLNLLEILAAFMVLFAIIDIPGSIPIILDIKAKTGDIEAGKASIEIKLFISNTGIILPHAR